MDRCLSFLSQYTVAYRMELGDNGLLPERQVVARATKQRAQQALSVLKKTPA